VVQGNFIGTDVSGTQPLPNVGDGVLISAGASGNLVGGTVAGAANVISSNLSSGVHIADNGTTGNLVKGNLIGTDATGTQPLGNAADGVVISGGASGNIVGGSVSAAGNVISANAADGVHLVNAATGNTVEGNFIGTDASGTLVLGNGLNGVHFEDTSDNNTVGGNTIAFSGNDGVLVDTATGDAIQHDSIHDSGNFGIELANGANNNQAFPVLTSATSDGSSTTIVGMLTSTPDTTFTLEFFANSVPSPSGYGEGATFLGLYVVTTDDSGNASFMVSFASGDTSGQWIAATATDPGNNTSSFSQDVAVDSASPDTPERRGSLDHGQGVGTSTPLALESGRQAEGQAAVLPPTVVRAADTAVADSLPVAVRFDEAGQDPSLTVASSSESLSLLLDPFAVDDVFVTSILG
jgi:hypothetical protein